MRKRLAIFICLAANAFAQWQPFEAFTGKSLRGVSASNRQIVWASGTHGTYLVTTDGGLTWRAHAMAGADDLEFRGVRSFGSEAYLLAAGAGEKSRIYHTSNLGEHWDLQFINLEPKGFLDCMAFFDRRHGIVVGDPVNGKFQVLLTHDGGASWRYVDSKNLPPAIEGEGAFAASNTCLATQGQKNAWFVTGGAAARVFRSTNGGKSWKVSEVPREMPRGEPSAGIFSVAFFDESHGVIAGGDYKQPERSGANLATSADGGKTWKLAPVEQQPYFSAVAYLSQIGCLVAVGPSASAFSGDGLRTWEWNSTVGFNAVVSSKDRMYAVGGQGRMAKAEVECASTNRRKHQSDSPR